MVIKPSSSSYLASLGVTYEADANIYVQQFISGKPTVLITANDAVVANIKQQNGGSDKGGVWGWMIEHFDVAIGYSLSYGAQIGGGKKGFAARINFRSTVHFDFEWSRRKGFEGNRYEPGEKVNWGIGGAWYGGVDYKGQTYQGVTEHELGIGGFGLGVKLKFDNSVNMTDWFWGFDPSVNMQLGWGIEGNFRIGFSKR